MELVYLWVEDYKNIKNQGFNFSPRFECEFDKKTKELKIDEKKDYINIFPKNINVTAIVGENGSGKSSIIKFIEDIHINNEIKPTFILVTYINNALKIKTNIKIQTIKNNSKYKNSMDNTNMFSLVTYYSEMPYPYEDRKVFHSENLNDFHTINIQKKAIYKLIANLLQTKNTSTINRLKFVFNPSSMQVNINDDYISNLMKFIHSKLDEDLSFKNKKISTSLEEKILPNKTKLIDNLINEVYENDGRYDDFLNLKAEEEFNSNKEFYKDNWKEGDYSMSDADIINELSSELIDVHSSEDFIKDTFKSNEILQYFLTELNIKLYSLFDSRTKFGNLQKNIAFKHDIFKIFLFYKILENELLENYLIFIIENYFEFYSNIETIDDLVEQIFKDSEINKIENFIKKNILEFDFEYIKFQQLLSSDSNKMNYFNQYYDFFEFTFLDDKNRTFNSLSHGEKSFFGQIISIYNYTLNSNSNNILFCFDEPEISLHTKWQQIYLKNLIYSLEQIDKKISLIFTSHSPFLLSDLPKENVIFLKKDKDGNCKNVTKETSIETFGANIHTLLSHGFFMDAGLMGEFAKEKIDLAITYLNKKKLSIEEMDYCENIIPIIGEPIIKNQLQRMLDSKRLSKIDKIDSLEAELELIKHRIEIMRKNQ